MAVYVCVCEEELERKRTTGRRKEEEDCNAARRREGVRGLGVKGRRSNKRQSVY